MKNNDFFKGRKVILIGNAKSVFNKERIIDSEFDIVCRINAGFPQGREQYIGSRTDVLFLSFTSLKLSDEKIKKLNPKQIIWCTPKKRFITEWIRKNALRYPIENWNCLYSALGHRPSTGIMAFEYLLGFDFESLTLIGFDFWKTPTWYNNVIFKAKHSPKDEEKYIRDKIKEYKGKIILKN